MKIFVGFKQPDDKNDEQAVNNHKKKINKQVKSAGKGGLPVSRVGWPGQQPGLKNSRLKSSDRCQSASTK